MFLKPPSILSDSVTSVSNINNIVTLNGNKLINIATPTNDTVHK